MPSDIPTTSATRRQVWDSIDSLGGSISSLEKEVSELIIRLNTVYTPPPSLTGKSPESGELMLSSQIHALRVRVGECVDTIRNITETMEI